MAGTCYLVYSGGTINLQDHTVGMDFTYTPTAPNMADEFAQDTAKLRIANASITNIRNALGSVSRALNEAQIYNNNGGGTAGVYLYLQPAGYPDAWRSEIIQGNIIPADYVLNAPIWETTGTKTIEFEMSFTRRNYFEGTLTPLTLSNPNGTSGTVYWDNYNDGGGIAGRKRYNYVDVAGTAVGGDLIAPVILTVIDNSTSAPDYRGFANLNIHVGWSADPTALTRLEAENGTLDGGSRVTSASYSNGTFVGTAGGFYMGITDYDKYQGNPYEIYLRASLTTSGTNYINANTYGYLNFPGTVLLTERVTLNVSNTTMKWLDMGQLHLPSTNYVGGTFNSQNVIGFFSGTTVNLDAVHMLPMDKRIIGKIDVPIHQMVFDTITGKHYGYGGYLGVVSPSAVQPITVLGDIGLMPGENQRIHFMDNRQTNYTNIDPLGTAFYTVSVSYRPRRLTI